MQRIEIDKDKPLNPGDRIEMHFNSVGMVWIKATQIALIELRLKGKPEFEILYSSIPTKSTVVFGVEIKKTNPVVVTAAVIAGAIVAAGLMTWLTLDKVYQLIESPAGKAIVGGTVFSFAALAVAALLMILPRRK